MSLVILSRYYDLGRGLIAHSALEAAGFHPSYQNYNHAHNAYLQMIALGGLIILIPEQEAQDAKAWLTHLQESPPLEGDPIPERKYGMWRHTLAIASFLSPLAIFFPLLFVKLKYAAPIIIAAYIALIIGTFLNHDLATLSLFFLGYAALSASMLVLLPLWPIRSILAIAIIWCGLIFTYGFEPSDTKYFLYLWPALIPLHAKYIALPRLQRRKIHVD